jgi:hypothetical protein
VGKKQKQLSKTEETVSTVDQEPAVASASAAPEAQATPNEESSGGDQPRG